MFKLKRIYEEPEEEDGYRVLVDRLWPRGVSKERANLDGWIKDIAPSNELRKWYNHELDKWPEFKTRYLNELNEKKDLLKQLKTMAKSHEKVTLLYSAKDEDHNNAVVLGELLNQPTKTVKTSISRIHGS
ncbi:protein of unknown function DUF488 [Methanobacterium lacus]|uniref:Uroporphyrin-III C-methyltransferase n=1 Tax=Methanobacterium lacus (strain AL-21) TaxID=877455 RepID=F0TAZ3_METLA|nr:DUF488 domain-containing protein [Methanobacterium lacus]ADZ10139.1 protein of unknown function DUF488 [Methanobacterium lacus]